jgi:hypothetical protein
MLARGLLGAIGKARSASCRALSNWTAGAGKTAHAPIDQWV